MTFDPSKYGWTDQDVLDAFINNPEGTKKYAKDRKSVV